MSGSFPRGSFSQLVLIDIKKYNYPMTACFITGVLIHIVETWSCRFYREKVFWHYSSVIFTNIRITFILDFQTPCIHSSHYSSTTSRALSILIKLGKDEKRISIKLGVGTAKFITSLVQPAFFIPNMSCFTSLRMLKPNGHILLIKSNFHPRDVGSC